MQVRKLVSSSRKPNNAGAVCDEITCMYTDYSQILTHVVIVMVEKYLEVSIWLSVFASYSGPSLVTDFVGRASRAMNYSR